MQKQQRALVLVTCISACLVVLIPIWAVTFPPFMDYPAHLARMHVLANLETSPALKNIYEIKWSLLPNLAMDAVVPVLSEFIPLNVAGKVFISMILIMWIAGPLLLHHALFGRVCLWPMIASFFAYNWCLAFGMLNFVFGAGLSFFVLAAWVYSATWPSVWRFLVFSVFATVLYFCHLIALTVYAVAVLGFEVARTIQSGELSQPRKLLGQGFLVAGQFAAPAIIFFFYSPTFGLIASDDLLVWGSLKDRLVAARSAVLFEWGPIDYLTFIVAAAIFLYALATRSLRPHRAFMWSIFVLLLVAILMPAGSDGGSLRHIRVPPVLAALVFAGTTWDGKRSRKSGVVVFTLCVILFLARTAITAERWQSHDSRLIEFRQAVTHIEEGSSLFPVLSSEQPADPWRTNPNSAFPFVHMINFSTIINSAFTPGVFSSPGLQPIRLTAPYEAVQVKLPHLMTWDQLLELPTTDPATNRDLNNWPRNFDYLLVLNLDHRKLEPPSFLTVFYVGSFFTIFKIEHGISSAAKASGQHCETFWPMVLPRLGSFLIPWGKSS